MNQLVFGLQSVLASYWSLPFFHPLQEPRALTIIHDVVEGKLRVGANRLASRLRDYVI